MSAALVSIASARRSAKAQTSTGCRLREQASAPRRSCGAAGAPNQTKMQAIVLEDVHSPMESTHKIESHVFGNFFHQLRHTLRRRVRLMEPAGASSFLKRAAPPFPRTRSWLSGRILKASLSKCVFFFSHFLFHHPTKPRVLGFS